MTKKIELDVPEATMQRLKNIAKAQKVKYSVLEKEWYEARNELIKNKFKGDADFVAVNKVMNKHRKFKVSRKTQASPLKTFVGFKIGDLGMQDWAERIREKAKRVVQTDGAEAAEELGLVKITEKQVLILDTREKVFGRPNDNHGEPLDPKLKLRTHDMFMLVKDASNGEFEFARLQTNDNKLAMAWNSLPFHIAVSFPALVKEHTKGYYLLSATTAKDNPTVFKQVEVDWTPYDEFVKWADPILKPIIEIPKYHQAVKSSWDRWVVVKGIVDYIGFENETRFGQTPGLLVDEYNGTEVDYQVRFYVPEHIKVDFGQYSCVYILGRTRSWTAVDPESNQRYTVDTVVDAWGFTGVKGKVIPKDSSLLEDLDEEEEEVVQGFIAL